MFEDIAYDKNFQTEYDEVGDIRTVDGADAVQQAVVTSVVEAGVLGGHGLNSTSVESTRSRIADAVQANEFTRPPYSVQVDSVNPTEQSVKYSVSTARLSFTLTDTT